MKLKQVAQRQRREDGPNSEATPGSPLTKPSLWARRRKRRAARKRARAQVTGARVSVAAARARRERQDRIRALIADEVEAKR